MSTTIDDDKAQRLLDRLNIDIFGSGSLKETFTDVVNKMEKKQRPLIFEGSPGTGKTQIMKNIMKILDDRLSDDKLQKNIKDFKFISTMNNPLPETQAKIDPALLARFKAVTMPPLGDEALQKIAEREIEKSGITGEHRDIVQETVRDGIDTGSTNPRSLIKWVRALVADPAHPDLEATRGRRAEEAERQAQEKVLSASRRQGSQLATLLASGAAVTIRPLKPIRFK